MRAILSVKYTPVSAKGGAGRAVSGFLRYVQYRDHHVDAKRVRDVEGLVRYVAYRDGAISAGRLFDARGTVGDKERRELARYVSRSIRNLPRQHVDGQDRRRAVYRMVLSPENARGLDLRELTRATMSQLERDSGPLPPWIAAEHRNTAHPHVHIVMAARREIAPNRFRTLVITRERLGSMKLALGRELERQGQPRSHEERPARPYGPALQLGRRFAFLLRRMAALNRLRAREAAREWERRERELGLSR